MAGALRGADHFCRPASRAPPLWRFFLVPRAPGASAPLPAPPAASPRGAEPRSPLVCISFRQSTRAGRRPSSAVWLVRCESLYSSTCSVGLEELVALPCSPARSTAHASAHVSPSRPVVRPDSSPMVQSRKRRNSARSPQAETAYNLVTSSDNHWSRRHLCDRSAASSTARRLEMHVSTCSMAVQPPRPSADWLL